MGKLEAVLAVQGFIGHIQLQRKRDCRKAHSLALHQGRISNGIAPANAITISRKNKDGTMISTKWFFGVAEWRQDIYLNVKQGCMCYLMFL